ncbi:MAG: hypothetical protein MZV63_71770 [Marinilabiliales bacterium]|nr:hypothetical protein [Marinilabiliales bacterium]
MSKIRKSHCPVVGKISADDNPVEIEIVIQVGNCTSRTTNGGVGDTVTTAMAAPLSTVTLPVTARDSTAVLVLSFIRSVPLLTVRLLLIVQVVQLQSSWRCRW